MLIQYTISYQIFHHYFLFRTIIYINKVYFWQPSYKVPYSLINTIANNQNLMQEEIAITAIYLLNNTLIGATDGSEKDGKQAWSWTLYDKKRDKFIEGSASVSGNPFTANSTRSKCGIQISTLHAIILSAQAHKIHSSKVYIYVDNISSFIKTKKNITSQWSSHTSHKWLGCQNNNIWIQRKPLDHP